jgi:alpha-L-fucosidase
MNVNSEAIYGARMFSVFGEREKIRFAQSKDGKTKFIFLFDFPDLKITLTKIAFDKTDKVQLPGNNKNPSWKQTVTGVEISIPAVLKTVINNVWGLKVKK